MTTALQPLIGLRGIARATGMSPTTVYRYFDSEDAPKPVAVIGSETRPQRLYSVPEVNAFIDAYRKKIAARVARSRAAAPAPATGWIVKDTISGAKPLHIESMWELSAAALEIAPCPNGLDTPAGNCSEMTCEHCSTIFALCAAVAQNAPGAHDDLHGYAGITVDAVKP